MIENISLSELMTKIAQWWKTFMWITIVSFVITLIVMLILPKQYKAVAVLFPSRQFSVSKLVIEANAGNQEDYMTFGDADDTEKLMQLLTCDELKIKVADAFGLWKRWNMKDTNFSYHYLKLKWEDQVTIKRTEFNSVRIEVYDYDANGAAIIANGISDYCDSVRKDMNREISGRVLKIVKAEYETTLQRMKVLEDSLDKLRQLGVLHFKEEVKAYSRSYAKALEKNDVGAMKRLGAKLDTLKKYGSAYQNMHDDLDKYATKYPDIKMKYDEALVNYNTMIPIKFVVEKAKPDEWKAKPKRALWIILAVVASNLMGLFFLLFREKLAQPSK